MQHPPCPPSQQLAQLRNEANQDAKDQAQFFFSDNAQNKRARGGRWTGPPPKQCWFCMSSEQYEAHLVASIAEAAYVALPKGGINGDHVLIVPVEHHPALVNAPIPVRKEVELYKASLAKYYAAKGQYMVAFERVAITRNPAHTHMQVIGLPAANAAAAPPIIRAEAARAGVPVTPLPHGESLQDYVVTALHGNVPMQYLYVELHAPPPGKAADGVSEVPEVHRFLHVVPEGASQPLQFGRDLMCALLQLPHRKHWRDCKLAQEQEEQLTNTFREGFQAHDFAADEDSSDSE